VYKFVQSGDEHGVLAQLTDDVGEDLDTAAGAGEFDQSVGTDPSPLPA
jgi:hypothetical protein